MRMGAERSLHQSASLDPSWEWGWGWIEGNATSFPLQEMYQLENILLRGPLRWSHSSATLWWANGGLGRRSEASTSKTPPLFRGKAGPHPPNPCSLLRMLATCDSFPPWLPFPTQGCSFLPCSSFYSLTKRTPEALPSACPHSPPLLWSPQATIGGPLEKQSHGQSKQDNYNLGRPESQAKKQGGSSSCRVWELGLSQKPSLTAQPPRETGWSHFAFPPLSQSWSHFIHSCSHSFIYEMLVMSLPHATQGVEPGDTDWKGGRGHMLGG